MRLALLAALLVRTASLAAAEPGILPVYLEDNHAGSFGWLAQVADLDQPHVLVLIDAHSDATAVDHSDAVREGLRRVVSEKQRADRIAEWRASGRIQAFNWIEPLMPAPVDRVLWVAGWSLSSEEKERLRREAAGSLDGRVEFEARAAGELGARWQTADAQDFDHWSPPPGSPVLATIDLDAFTGLAPSEAVERFHRIWVRLLTFSNLRAVSFAISRPWLRNDDEAFRLTRIAVEEIRLAPGARLEIEPHPTIAPDDSWQAQQFTARGMKPPAFDFARAPIDLQAALTVNRRRWVAKNEPRQWTQWLDDWMETIPQWEIRADDAQASTDGIWRIAEGPLPAVRLWNPQPAPIPARVKWYSLSPAAACYNLMPDLEIGKGFTHEAPPWIRAERTLLAETNDGALSPESWSTALDRRTGWGRVRIEAEVERAGAWISTPPIELRVVSGDGFHAGLSEQFGVPYAFGIAFAHADGVDGADTGWGNDCANFLVAAWRRTGRAFPWGNPAQLRAHLRTLASDATVVSKVPISREDIRRGIAIDFGEHVAALWEDRDPKGVLGPEDIVVHHLGGVPERTTLGELAKSRPRFAVRTLPADSETRVMIGGDVVLAQATPESVHRLAANLQGAALSLVNLEGVPAEHSRLVSKRFNFAFPPERLQWLEQAGVQAIGMANNHAGDAGPGGLLEAFQAIRHTGLAVFGAGTDDQAAVSPWLTEVCGRRLAIFAVACVECDSASPNSPGVACLPQHAAQIEAAIQDAKAQGRTVIVLVHWGSEFTLEINEDQRKWARWLIDHGADAIAGAHPHVVQALDYWRGRPIAYSLGNGVYPKILSRLASGAWLELRLNPHGEIESASLQPVVKLPAQESERER